LEAEINPHFLFNTLDVIYWTVAVNQNDTALKMIKALSDTFRLTLERSKDGLTSLSNEILHVKGYLFIEETRLKEKLKYSIEIQEGLEKYRVMQFILQPLVENAVTHGIRDGKGEVLVDVCEQNGDLLLSVHNDGNDVNLETIERLIHEEPSGRRGYALYNINERLQLNFGSAYGVTCRCPADGGTTFMIRHPIIAPKKEDER
jgi:two-component system sensor histidine kinase YesM